MGPWPISKVIHDGPSAYVDPAVNRDRQIPCVYEADNDAKVVLARFNIDQLTDGMDSLRPKTP
jgi:hypothetical protein